MILNLSDEALSPLQMTEDELRLELAIGLYATGKLSFGKSCELANLDWVRFRRILAERLIEAHYNQDDFENDLLAIQSLSSAA